MNPVQFATEIRRLNERSETMLVLLYEVVERTGNHREGYYALRQFNDLSFGVIHRANYEPDSDHGEVFEHVVRDIDNVLATLQTAIDRIDR